MGQSKKTIRLFNKDELSRVDKAVVISEELVNNFYKMSSGQWLKNRYDIQTIKDLAPHERVDGPVAQVIKYEAQPKTVLLGSSIYSLYKVCLQDQTILSTIGETDGLYLDPFLLYILTHELIHIVRFSKYEQRYEKKNEADVGVVEERKVHILTREILHPISVPGLSKVFDFYRDWMN